MTLAGRAPGSVGEFGIYSFNFNKLISTGGGGMVVTQTAEDLARIRHLGSQAKVPGSDYVHDEVGFNYRLSNVAAAIGAHQIARLDDLVAAAARPSRSATATRSRRSGSRVVRTSRGRVGPAGSRASCSPTRRHARRGAERARRREIEARPIWPPLRTQAPYPDAPVLGGTTAVSIASRVLCLPCAAHLTTEQQDEVIDRVLAVLRSG